MADNLIRQANENDIEPIMGFIKKYWSDTHILANDRKFFEYEHKNGGEVCFVLSEDPETLEMQAILGFIPYGKRHRDAMIVMWKVKPNENAFLGVKLLQFLIQNIDARIVGSCGINKRVAGIYQYLGYHTGSLAHYYRIADREEYKVALIKEKNILPVQPNGGHSLDRLRTFQETENRFDFYQYKDCKPFKEPWYIEKRYFNHPVYTYEAFGIADQKNDLKTLLFAREIDCNGTKVLRIVDLIGEAGLFRYVSADIQRLIDEKGYEYIDFYQHGITGEIMEQAGFTLKAETPNIIPNYFEPFVQENIDIDYFTIDNEGFNIYKGDGDQDRPSLINRSNSI